MAAPALCRRAAKAAADSIFQPHRYAESAAPEHMAGQVLMKIECVDFVAGAREARGLVVVIDVFRAFSVAAYGFRQGAARIFPAGEIAHAYSLKERYPGALLVGERHGRKLEGFDFGNSPTEILAADLRGKTIIQSTHAGTQGLVNAGAADEVLTGSFVNARATAEYILARKPAIVTLVRMGLEARTVSDEDALYALYLTALLKGARPDPAPIREMLTTSAFSERFFDPSKLWSPESDFHHCLRFDAYSKAIVATRNDYGDLEIAPAQARETQRAASAV